MLPRSLHPTMGKLRALFDHESEPKLSTHDVEARLYVDQRNAREYIKILHAERYIYLCEFRRDTPHGLPTPVYARRTSEDQVDAKRPKAKHINQLRRDIRSDPERWEHELKQARIRRKRKKFLAEPIKVDPLTMAVNRDFILSGL